MFLWIKVLHVIAVISWMAGMLYLPRLFVYHAEQPAGTPMAATFITMEGRLMKIIMRPAATVVLLTGIYFLFFSGTDYLAQGWMHVKLTAVVLLFAAHGVLEGWTRTFARGANTKSPRFFRAVNEIPAVLMVIIVAMVIAKPF
jgi:putative membrane protein